MQWWAWLLIWAGLVIAMLVMVALLGYRLFTKAMTAFRALGKLTETLERLDAAEEQLDEKRFVPSVIRDRDEVEEEWERRRGLRDEARERRAAARLARGRLLVSADLRQRTFPWESSATHSPGGI